MKINAFLNCLRWFSMDATDYIYYKDELRYLEERFFFSEKLRAIEHNGYSGDVAIGLALEKIGKINDD